MSQAIIVVPCYNEALRLDVDAFRAFARENRRQRFLFVDDGSTDATLEVLEALRQSDPECFSVLALSRNGGKAEAVRQGMLRALQDRPEYVGYWDADLATPLEATLTFCSVLDSRFDIDLVFGTRVSLLGRSVERNAVRHYLGRIFATAASATLGVGFYDTQCGAKLFRASHEIAELFREPFGTRWIFDVEILARLRAARRGTERPQLEEIVYEFPLHEWHDVAGSKVKVGDFLKSFFGLVAIRWQYGSMVGAKGRARTPVPAPNWPSRTSPHPRTRALGDRPSPSTLASPTDPRGPRFRLAWRRRAGRGQP